MIHNSQFLYSFKLLGDIFKSILFFPFWWFSRGLFLIIEKEIGFLINRQKSLALLVWIKNIHKPMYAQSDWQGRLISFFMRLFQIFFRSLVMAFWVLVTFTLVGAWILLPIFVTYEVIFQLGLI